MGLRLVVSRVTRWTKRDGSAASHIQRCFLELMVQGSRGKKQEREIGRRSPVS